MSVTRIFTAMGRQAIRRPGPTLRWLTRMARAERLRIVLRLIAELSPSTRARLHRPLLSAADAILRRRPLSSRGLTLKCLALWGLGREEEAVALALGVDPVAPQRAVLALARFCAAIDRPEPAYVLLARLPPSSRQVLALRAEIAWRTGQLSAAREAASAALRTRGPRRDLEWLLDRVEGELRALTPGWRPAASPAHRESRTREGSAERGRVMHLLTNSLPYRQSGYTLRSHQIGQWQLRSGLDPHMVTRAGFPGNEGQPDAPMHEQVDGVPYHRLVPDLEQGIRLDRLLELNVAGASRLLEQLEPAVLHPTTNHFNAQVALALREAYGLPVVYEVRGFLEETRLSKFGELSREGERYGLARDNETACMRDADGVVTLSETMKREITERGVPSAKITVIPNAVDETRFSPGPPDAALAARLGVGERIVLGYVSSLVEYEGIEHLIDATAILRSRGRPVCLLLVGDGPERASLQERARRLGLEGDVFFTGRVPFADVLRYYGIIDIFVVPRTNARVCHLVTPLKPYEAMALERPILVSQVGALLEIVQEGKTGRSFRPEDPEDLAAVVEPLLGDPAERARMGAAAREWVLRNRTWRQNAERYRSLYEALGAA